jgi:hypothetical protein
MWPVAEPAPSRLDWIKVHRGHIAWKGPGRLQMPAPGAGTDPRTKAKPRHRRGVIGKHTSPSRSSSLVSGEAGSGEEPVRAPTLSTAC